jgi:hypothetical protein
MRNATQSVRSFSHSSQPDVLGETLLSSISAKCSQLSFVLLNNLNYNIPIESMDIKNMSVAKIFLFSVHTKL